VEDIEKLYAELGRVAYAKLDALAQSGGEDAPELDFFLSDGAVIALLNRISAASGAVAPPVCPKCGEKLLPNSRFCIRCGGKL